MTTTACEEVEGDAVFSEEGMPGMSGLKDPPSCNHWAPEEPALGLEDSSASEESSESAPLLPDKRCKNIAVASSPTDDDGGIAVASSASSVVTQAAASVQAGIPEYNVGTVSYPYRPNNTSAIVKPSPGIPNTAVVPPNAEAASAVASAAVSPDAQENCAVNVDGGARRPPHRSQNGLNRGRDAVTYNGGGPVVDLRRARRLREDDLWSTSCLACREENPQVRVKPCQHYTLCRRCFLDPHFSTDLVSVCPVCRRPSEGLMFTKDMIYFLIRRSAV